MSGASQYIPQKGHVVLINFKPSTGKEITKYRPAVVVSNTKYSELTGLALVCPITHAAHNHLVESGLLIKVKTKNIDGYINPLQFHTYDFRKRDMKYIENIDMDDLKQTIQIINDIVNASE